MQPRDKNTGKSSGGADANEAEAGSKFLKYRVELSARVRDVFALRKPKSVTALAERIGVSRNAVYSWMSGESVPDVAHLKLFADELAVSLEWLVSGHGFPEGSPAGYVMPMLHSGALARSEKIEASPFAFQREWLQALEPSFKGRAEKEIGNRLLLVEIRDDAMLPTLARDDFGLCLMTARSLVREAKTVPPNGLYLMQGFQIRRIEWQATTLIGLVRCDNAAYGTEVKIKWPPKEGTIYGRILWYGRRP